MVESFARLGRLARNIAEAKYITCGVWLVLAAVGSFFASKVFEVTSFSVNAPHGSASEVADAAFVEYFPDVGISSDFAVLIRCNGGCGTYHNMFPVSVIELSTVINFSRALYVGLNASLEGEMLAFSSYFSLVEQGMPPSLAYKQLVSSNSQATLVSWTVRGASGSPSVQKKGQDAQDLVARLQKEWLNEASDMIINSATGTPLVINAARDQHPSSFLSGMPLVIGAALVAGQQDMELMDQFALPFAVFIFGLVVASVRLMMIPCLYLPCLCRYLLGCCME